MRGHEADRGHTRRDRRAAAARRPRAGRPADHRRGGEDEVPREGGERCGEARRPARGPARSASWRFSTRSRSSGSGASGRSPARKLRDRGIMTVGQVASWPRLRSSRCSAARPAATSTRSRTTAIPGRCRLAAAAARSARSARSVGPPRSHDEHRRRPGRTRRPRHAAHAGSGRVGRTVVLRLRFDDFTRATRSYTLPRATAETQTILATARGLLAAAMPMIERQGLTLVGIAVANLDDATPSSSRCRSTAAAAAPSTPRSTRCVTGSGRRRSPGRSCSAATRAWSCRCSPTEARPGRIRGACRCRTLQDPAHVHVHRAEEPEPRSSSATARAAAWARATPWPRPTSAVGTRDGAVVEQP